MTIEETGKVMDLLKTAYPQFYRNQTVDERLEASKLWAAMFAEDDLLIVLAAVKALIAADEKGFPPVIGAVKARIRQISAPAEMSEMEAWNLVSRAIRRPCGTTSQGLFDELPGIVREILGSPQTLVEWGRIDEQTVNSVIMSNFMRSYKAKAAIKREYDALPGDVRKMVAAKNDAGLISLQPMPKAHAPISDCEWNSRRNAAIKALEGLS